MSEKYDLEDRTRRFARDVRTFIRSVPKSITNAEDCRQLANSSGSVGANYIEANEHLSDDDFIYRIKVCKKEAKESRYWLNLLDLKNNQELMNSRDKLVQEATELIKIFGSIIRDWGKGE